MQIAKTAVKRQLQAEGLKVWQFSAKQITMLAEDHFANHKEALITKAVKDINTWPGFERWRLPDCQDQPKSTTSVVQNSSAERRAEQ